MTQFKNIATIESNQAGIAIGPILFIIAILAILAAAIAAGSGSFNAPTALEGNKTKASALIQVGDNLRTGMDRLTMENSVSWSGWTIGSSSTSNLDLFSPTGGGVAPPSTALAASPANDTWYYPVGAVGGLGNNDQLAVLNVTSDVCNEVNNRTMGVVASYGGNLGNFAASNPTTEDTSIGSNWPANLNGKTVGCVQNGDMNNQYYFYEVLFVN